VQTKNSNFEIQYLGEELEIFQHAHNWKSYFASRIAPYFGTRVLEVGAGFGGTTVALTNRIEPKPEHWLSLEPDPRLFDGLKDNFERGVFPSYCEVMKGTVDNLIGTNFKFDTILYVDVLEHIEDDSGEIEKAMQLLSSNGRIVIIGPAHNFLFSDFDSAIGHFRRYDYASIAKLQNKNLSLKFFCYLDSLGCCLSLANRWLLKSSKPSIGQISFWDTYVVPFSRFLDPLFNYKLGKSVVAVLELK